jgi:arylsulfatase
MPTCLEIAGITYPEKFNGHSILPPEGLSLVPALKNKPVKREFLLWEHSANRAIRMGDWKLVAKVRSQKKFIPADENNWELYNLKKDPSETKNLATKYPEKVKMMAEKWDKEALRTKMKPWPWSE